MTDKLTSNFRITWEQEPTTNYRWPAALFKPIQSKPQNKQEAVITGDRTTVALAVAMLKFRRARPTVLPQELFGEPSWDLLLELYVADALGQRLTARDVGERSKVSVNVMSRWLLHLSRIGLVVGDGNGDIDDLLTLSGNGMESLERLMSEAAELNKMTA